VVSSCDEWVGQIGKHSFSIVANPIGFAVHEFGRSDDFPAEGLSDRLMSQANAQDWEFAMKFFDDFDADSGFVGRAGAWRQ
jgi:hypothetical protein